MRSQKSEPHQTWAWGDILEAVCETDAALRRKLQRGQVKFELDSEAGRTRATLWDIAKLRVARHLCDIGIEAAKAFGLAKLLVERAYKDQIEGTARFTKSAGEKQKFLFAITPRGAGGFRLVEIDPAKSQLGLTELGMSASDPKNIIVPIHSLLLDAWYRLPYLTDDIAAWLRASSANMHALQSKAAK